MALFKRDFSKPGPGVPKNAPRKKGFGRFFEILSRDMAGIFRLNLLYILCCLPSQLLFAAALFCWLFVSPTWFLLFGVAALAASILVGPAQVCLYHALTRMLRDDPGFVWHGFKKTFKSNFKDAALPGIIYSLIMGSQVIAILFYVMTVLAGGSVPFIVVIIYLFLMLLVNMAAPYFFMQVAYLDLNRTGILRNSLLFALGYVPRTLAGMLLSLLILGGQLALVYIFPPLIILPLIGGVAIGVLVRTMWYWPQVDKTFGIEKTLKERTAKELDESLAEQGIEPSIKE